MEKKNYYSVKDIILGSRSIYQENERYLKLLRLLTDSYDKNVKDFYFKLSTYKDNPTVVCHFVQSLKTLKGLIIYLQMKTNTYYNGREMGRCIKTPGGEYVIANDEYEAFIKFEDMKSFAYITEKILESDFANKMEFGHKRDQHKTALSILPSGIYIKSIDLGRMMKCNYVARTDSIDITAPRSCEVGLDQIATFLDYRFPAELLSDYHKQVIDENPATEKILEIISDSRDTSSAHIRINEKEHEFVLKKVKYKKPTIN